MTQSSVTVDKISKSVELTGNDFRAGEVNFHIQMDEGCYFRVADFHKSVLRC